MADLNTTHPADDTWPDPERRIYRSPSDFFRDLGDRALETMTRRDLIETACAIDSVDRIAENLARLANGLGCLIVQDAEDKRERRFSTGALQGSDAIAAFSTIAEGIDTIAALTYVSSRAMSKLQHPEVNGYPVEETRHE